MKIIYLESTRRDLQNGVEIKNEQKKRKFILNLGKEKLF